MAQRSGAGSGSGSGLAFRVRDCDASGLLGFAAGSGVDGTSGLRGMVEIERSELAEAQAVRVVVRRRRVAIRKEGASTIARSFREAPWIAVSPQGFRQSASLPAALAALVAARCRLNGCSRGGIRPNSPCLDADLAVLASPAFRMGVSTSLSLPPTPRARPVADSRRAHATSRARAGRVVS